MYEMGVKSFCILHSMSTSQVEKFDKFMLWVQGKEGREREGIYAIIAYGARRGREARKRRRFCEGNPGSLPKDY